MVLCPLPDSDSYSDSYTNSYEVNFKAPLGPILMVIPIVIRYGQLLWKLLKFYLSWWPILVPNWLQ